MQPEGRNFLLCGGVTTELLRKTAGEQGEPHPPPCARRRNSCSSNSNKHYITDDKPDILHKLVWAVKDGCVAAPALPDMVPLQRVPCPKQGASAEAKVKGKPHVKAKPQAKANGKPVQRSSGKRAQQSDPEGVHAAKQIRHMASSSNALRVGCGMMILRISRVTVYFQVHRVLQKM